MKDEMLRELDKDYERKNLTMEQYASFKAEIIAKGEQSEKLIEDRKAQKIDDELFENWYAQIFEDYKDISARKREAIDENLKRRKKKAESKFRRPFVIAGILILVGGGVYFLLNYLYTHRQIKGIPEPIQVATSDEEIDVEHELDGDELFGIDYYLRMKYLASYDIKGLVMGTHTFKNEDVYERAFPFDVSLAWGAAAENRAQLDCKNGPRKLTCSYPASLMEKYSRTTISSSYSNNHLTPADKEVRDKIFRIRPGDYIEIKGYLVSARMLDKAGTDLTLTSSLVRTDHMDGAFDRTNTGCELIYVTSIDWLEPES